MAGMHRSGTSAMARVLSLLGAALPREVMPAADSNDAGHWEPQGVVDLNDALLGGHDAAWDAMGDLPFAHAGGPRLDRYQRNARLLIDDQYARAPTIVVKDPRISLLADFWHRALNAAGYDPLWIVMVRSPADVAASLGARNGMDFADACRLWTAYTANVEVATRGRPRMFCRYEDLLGDPAAVVARLAVQFGEETIGRDAIAVATASIEPRLRHHAEAEAAGEVPAPVVALRTFVDALATGLPPGDDAALPALEWLHATTPHDAAPPSRGDQLTRVDVKNGFQLLLGRDIGAEAAVDQFLHLARTDFLRALLHSEEFTLRTAVVCAPARVPGTGAAPIATPFVRRWASRFLPLTAAGAAMAARAADWGELLAAIFGDARFQRAFADTPGAGLERIAATLRLRPPGHYPFEGCRPPPMPTSEADVRASVTIAPIVVARDAEIALLLTRTRTGAIAPHVAAYAAALARLGVAVVLVVVADRPARISRAVRASVAGIVACARDDRNFRAWAETIERYPALLGAATLYLLDDSVVPGLDDAALAATLAAVRAADEQVVALTEGFDGGWHAQDYFLALKPGVLGARAAQDFLAGQMTGTPILSDRRFAAAMEEAGFPIRILFDGEAATDPTIAGWKPLLDRGFPFVRVGAPVDEAGDLVGFDATLLADAATMAEPRAAARESGLGGLSTHRGSPAGALDIALVGEWDVGNAPGDHARRLIQALRRGGHRLTIVRRDATARRGPLAMPGQTDFARPADLAILRIGSGLPLLPAQQAIVAAAGRRVAWLDAGGAESVASLAGQGIDRLWAADPAAAARRPVDGLPVDTLPAGGDDGFERDLAALLDKAIAGREAVPDGDPVVAIAGDGIPVVRGWLSRTMYVLPLAADGAAAAVAADDPVPDGAGEWVVLAPAGASLARDVEAVLLAHAARNPAADILFADDVAAQDDHAADLIRLKPALDRTLLAAQDYVGAPVMVRASAFAALGGLDAARGTAAIGDLLFRAIDDGRIAVHVPVVLLAHPGRRVRATPADHRAMLRAQPSLAGFAIGPGRTPTSAEVRRDFEADGFPAVTLVVPTCRAATADGTPRIARLLASLAGTDWPMDRLTVLVGDDIADRPSWAANDRPFRLDWQSTPRGPHEPFNYAAKMNALWRQATTEQIVFVNDDVEVLDGGWLQALQTFATDRTVGGVGARLLSEAGRLRHAGLIPQGGTFVHGWWDGAADAHGYQDWPLVQREWSCVTGAVFATRRAAMVEVGGFDERFALEYNDTDLCLRLRQAGYRIVYTPFAELIHAERASRGDTAPPPEQTWLFHRRWADWIAGDPAWHPHLHGNSLTVRPDNPAADWFPW